MCGKKIVCLLAVFCLINRLIVVESYPARWERNADDNKKSSRDSSGKGGKDDEKSKKGIFLY